MIYIVSGFPRSGTSMMMRCLEAGGMDVVMGERRNKLAEHCSDDDYKMNPDLVLYELTVQESLQPWTYQHGKVVKMPTPWLNKMPTLAGDVTVVYMRRDPEECRQSYQAALDPKFKMTTERVAAMQEWGVREWKRRSASVLQLEYTEVLKHPERTFLLMQRNGWPVEPVSAAAVVDPEQYRFRIEKLTVGL